MRRSCTHHRPSHTPADLVYAHTLGPAQESDEVEFVRTRLCDSKPRSAVLAAVSNLSQGNHAVRGSRLVQLSDNALALLRHRRMASGPHGIEAYRPIVRPGPSSPRINLGVCRGCGASLACPWFTPSRPTLTVLRDLEGSFDPERFPQHPPRLQPVDKQLPQKCKIERRTLSASPFSLAFRPTLTALRGS